MSVDSRHLEVFAAVAREGSFTRAAAHLHLVQSAVSATIASLESDLGERLFDRTTRRVRPTAAGRALLPHATAILAALQAARDAVEEVSGGLSGFIRVGYMTNVALGGIPRLLRRFQDAHPAVSLRLTPSATGTVGLADGLRRGDLDVAFLAGRQEDHPDLRIDVLATAALGLAVAADDPLAGRRGIRLADTAAMRFVDFPPGFAARSLVDAEFRRRGLRRDVQIESSDLNDTAVLVQHGLGVGFLPRYLAEDDEHLHWIEIEDASLEIAISVATACDRPLGAAAARLVALVQVQAVETRASGAAAPPAVTSG
jgi:DNA-binding transcriptional LysR family regulator